MELETLLENLYEEYSLFHSGSILQFIEGKDFKIGGHLKLAIMGFLSELEKGGKIARVSQYYLLILTEEDKETLIKVLKSEEES